MEPRTASVPVRFGPFEVSPDSGELRKNGTRLKLTGQAIQVLVTLLERPGQLVTREELQEKLWPGASFGDFEHGINAVIKRLRDVLGDSATQPEFIETIPRRGYRFVGPVASSRPEPAEGTERPEPTVITPELRFVVRRSFWTIALPAAVIATAAVAYWFMKPPPLPRIIGSHPLTHTGYRKVWDEGCCMDQRLLTDGQRVIFQENRFSGSPTMQVSRTGGEVSEVLGSSPKIGGLRDISRDGSEILNSIVDPKTFAIDAWVHPLSGGPGRLIVKDAQSPRWTPDGRTMLFARTDQQNFQTSLYSANSDGTGVRRLAAALLGIRLLNISPDGHRIRSMSRGGAQLWEANSNGSNAHLLFPADQGRTLMGDWSPDGKYFFFTKWSGDQHDLWVLPETKYPWKRASQPFRLTSGPMSIVSPTVSKDGNQLYAVAIERHGELAVYERKAGKFVRYMAGLPACYVDFSRDGQSIAYVSYPEGSLWRSRIDGSERQQLTVPPMAVINPRWSPDGKLIAFSDIANGDRRRMSAYTPSRIFSVSAAGGGPTLLAADGGDPTWSADGRAIAYHFQLPGHQPEIRILNLGSMESSTVPGSQGMFSPRWSPDGKYLAVFNRAHKSLAIYSFASKTWTDLFKGPFLNWPSWSHDSKSIYVEASILNVSDSLIRVGIEDHKTETIAPLNEVRYTAFYFWNDGWFGLTPDDRPITTLDTGIEEIYAFDLEYK